MDGGDEQSEDEGEREWTEGEKDVLRRVSFLFLFFSFLITHRNRVTRKTRLGGKKKRVSVAVNNATNPLLSKQTVDTYVAQASTLESPFCGAPPSNLTHVIARAILSSTPPQTPLEGTPTPTGGGKRKWRHGLKATRAKILALGSWGFSSSEREREQSG